MHARTGIIDKMIKSIMFLATLLSAVMPVSAHALTMSSSTGHAVHVSQQKNTKLAFVAGCSSYCQVAPTKRQGLKLKNNIRKRIHDVFDGVKASHSYVRSLGSLLHTWIKLMLSSSWRPPDIILLSGTMQTTL
jgi:hypothetical protein